MKCHNQATLLHFKAPRQRPQSRSLTINALNQYSSLQPKDLQPINLSYDLDGQQKSAKGKALQQPDRDFEACARLNERKSEERIPRRSGNCYMLTNGIWSFTWDGENRLKEVYSNETLLVVNVYDDQSRRIRKVTDQGTRSFVYDGWNPIRETIGASTKYYCWGTDLSGTLQGAGGVGGLQAVIVDGETPATYYPCYDANGNITAYVDDVGIVRAEYAFDAFGQTISQSGDLASSFSHRFSTKYADDEAGLYYYGFRFYSPELGRWVNRDPIEEQGGLNVYGFVGNEALSSVDVLGLLWWIEHNSSTSYAIAKRKTGDRLKELAKRTGFSYEDVMGWARKDAAGSVFSSLNEAESSCEVYLPNRILLALPDGYEDTTFGETKLFYPYLKLRYLSMKGMRSALSGLGRRYEISGFMVETFDYASAYESVDRMKAQKGWPTMGLLIGGHGNPPLRWLSHLGWGTMAYAPPGGNVDMRDNGLLDPSDFQMNRNNYRYQSLLVSVCYAGMTDWRSLASPESPSVYVAPSRPATLLDFPLNFAVPTY